MQFMQEQLQQMQNESELAFNQIKLIKDQLNIEIAARIDAQVGRCQGEKQVHRRSFVFARIRILISCNAIENS